MLKNLIFLLLLTLTANSLYAQFYKSVLPSPQFTSALEKIVLDFREDYRNIQGTAIEKLGEVEIYQSAVELPGTVDCRITRYNSVVDTSSSWQAIVYTGDEYKEAAKAYQNIFRLVKKSQIKWIDRSSVGFSGEMEAPREEMRFTTSTLTLNLDDPRYKNYQAEIEIQFLYNRWEVHLNLSKKASIQ